VNVNESFSLLLHACEGNAFVFSNTSRVWHELVSIIINAEKNNFFNVAEFVP